MNNALKTGREMSSDIADNVSRVAQDGLDKVSEGSQVAMEKSAQAAKYLQQTRGVTYVTNNPLKTIAVVAAAGIILYSIFGRKKKVTRPSADQQ